MPLDTLLEMSRTQFGVLVGPPERIVEHLIRFDNQTR
jgi:hypothetical protein